MKLKDPAIYLIVFFLILSLADIVREYGSGESLQHLAFEIVICVSATVWSFYLWYRWLSTKKELREEIAAKLQLNNEYLEFKNKNLAVLDGMGKVIAQQFVSWGLTSAETDVAYLLLKGLPFKEIATLRGNSEKTIRQHAMKIYQKSGLQGRTELFAYFFEDLFSQNTINSF